MKKLPAGMEFFQDIISNGYYYVDKTGIIRDLLNSGNKVTLFTRPRRFGKSLNMDTIKSFFETGTDHSLFNGLEISKEKELCSKYQGKYPVISISLKSAEGSGYEKALLRMSKILKKEIRRHQYLLQSSQLSENDKKDLKPLFEENLSEDIQEFSLSLLSEMLYKHYGRKVIILIDEYDVPLDKACHYGYYDEMLQHIRLLFGEVLKTNIFLEFAVLTGCLRISKESIFTGLNNFKTMTISDRAFSKYFGFTDEEVKEMLCYYGIEDKSGLFKEWYDGYRFGGNSIYCPWDVINQCSEFCESKNAEMKPHWINSSSNYIIKDILDSHANTIKRQMEELVSGECIRQEIIPGLVYPDLKSSDSRKRQLALWSVLYTTGYLTDAKEPDGNIHTLVIPNREIQEIYQKQILEWFIGQTEYSTQWNSLCNAVENGSAKETERILDSLLKRFISIRGTFYKGHKEYYYHGLLLGLFAINNGWYVKSEQESGNGFADILVEISEKKTGCIFEIKYADSANKLEEASKDAIKQIEQTNYAAYFELSGMEKIYKFGAAFYKKECKITIQKV
ncbi:MAG: AAA family ATPase [Lachnospiraceae bacterium]|nr:AAA family ATPase [Lachnospiraceae bacterium]